jgi:hypothetical protein
LSESPFAVRETANREVGNLYAELDAIDQAIEAYVNQWRNDFSDAVNR